MPQHTPDAKSKVTRVCVHKTRSDSPIATMAVNQREFIFAHLPSLLDNLAKSSVEHDFSRMVAVKVDFHTSTPVHLNSGLMGHP